jgi:hypothetical protein
MQQIRQTYREATGKAIPKADPQIKSLDEELKRQAHYEWTQQPETKELIQFLQRRERELLSQAQVAAQQERGETTLARLLNQSKATKDILSYVRTGKDSN